MTIGDVFNSVGNDQLVDVREIVEDLVTCVLTTYVYSGTAQACDEHIAGMYKKAMDAGEPFKYEVYLMRPYDASDGNLGLRVWVVRA